MIRKHSLAEDLVTVDEFFELVADGQKADLIDGVIHMASPDSLEANDLNAFLVSLMRQFVAASKSGGKVLVSRYAFRLSDIRAPEPDVAYIRSDRLHLAERRAMQGAPDIAVEIVSRESRSRDYGEKRDIYEQAGVREYWIIDPLRQSAEFLRLRDGKLELVPLDDGRFFRSEALSGFWLDIQWLLAGEPPNDYDCLQAVLAGPPGG
jgi:Uma2 family endonuclease